MQHASGVGSRLARTRSAWTTFERCPRQNYQQRRRKHGTSRARDADTCAALYEQQMAAGAARNAGARPGPRPDPAETITGVESARRGCLPNAVCARPRNPVTPPNSNEQGRSFNPRSAVDQVFSLGVLFVVQESNCSNGLKAYRTERGNEGPPLRHALRHEQSHLVDVWEPCEGETPPCGDSLQFEGRYTGGNQLRLR